jgi:hypothetical protein
MTTYINAHSFGSTVPQSPAIRSAVRSKCHHQDLRDHYRRIYGDALDRWTNEGGALGASYPSVRSNSYRDKH